MEKWTHMQKAVPLIHTHIQKKIIITHLWCLCQILCSDLFFNEYLSKMLSLRHEIHKQKHTYSFRKYFLLSPCSCAVYGLWICAPHRKFLLIMFHHGTRGKAEDRTFLELRLQTVSLVGNPLTPVTSNLLFRCSMHVCIHTIGFGPYLYQVLLTC